MVAIDVVTEDGNEIHCSAVENEELYWLARGGGPGINIASPSGICY